MINILRSSTSLAKVLVLPFVVLIIVLSLLIGMLSYFTGRQAVLNVAEQMLNQTADRIALNVQRHVEGAADMLESAFPTGLSAASDVSGGLDAIRARLWSAGSLHPDLSNYVYYGNHRGDFIGLFRNTAQDGELRVKYVADKHLSAYAVKNISGPLGMAKTYETDFDPRSRPWYIASKDARSETWSDIYIDYLDKQLVVTLARRVLTPEGLLDGVAAADVSLKALNDFVSDLHVSPRGIAFIMEASGNLIASSDGHSTRIDQDSKVGRMRVVDSANPIIRGTYAYLQNSLAEEQVTGNARRTFSLQGADGETFYAAYSWVHDNAGLSWVTVVAVPRDDILDTLDRNVRWTMLIAVTTVILALLVGLSVVRWVVRDVRRLSRAAIQIGKGQMNVTMKIERSDEIGLLARSFMSMQKELSTDKLTGATSRGALLRYLDFIIHKRGRRVNEMFSQFTLMFIDLNRFKAINDTLGHAYGDLTLVEVTQRLRSIVRGDDIVARFGGDEFVLVFWGIATPEFADKARKKIEDILAPTLQCLQEIGGGEHMTVGASVGVAFYPQDGKDVETLIKLADHGMYKHKAAGREKC